RHRPAPGHVSVRARGGHRDGGRIREPGTPHRPRAGPGRRGRRPVVRAHGSGEQRRQRHDGAEVSAAPASWTSLGSTGTMDPGRSTNRAYREVPMSRSEPATVDGSGAAEARARFARILDGDADAWAALTDQYTNLLWSIGRGLGLSHADTAEAVQIT